MRSVRARTRVCLVGNFHFRSIILSIFLFSHRSKQNRWDFCSVILIRHRLHKGHGDALVAIDVQVDGVDGIPTRAGGGGASRYGDHGGGDGSSLDSVTAGLERCKSHVSYKISIFFLLRPILLSTRPTCDRRLGGVARSEGGMMRGRELGEGEGEGGQEVGEEGNCGDSQAGMPERTYMVVTLVRTALGPGRSARFFFSAPGWATTAPSATRPVPARAAASWLLSTMMPTPEPSLPVPSCTLGPLTRAASANRRARSKPLMSRLATLASSSRGAISFLPMPCRVVICCA